MTELTISFAKLRELVSKFPAPSSPRGYKPFKEFFLESIYRSFSAPNWIEASKNDVLAGSYNKILLDILQKRAPTYYVAKELVGSACHTSAPTMETHEIPFNHLNVFTPNGLAMAVRVLPMFDESGGTKTEKMMNEFKELVSQKSLKYNAHDAKVMITALVFTKIPGHKCIRYCMDIIPPFGENKDILVCTPQLFDYGDNLNDEQIYSDMSAGDLARLIVNTLMLITYQPSLVNVEKSSTSGFGFNQNLSNEPMPVRWLGKGFCNSKAKASAGGSETSLGGTHASPRAHWRRGHWHGYRYGEGRKALRRKWVQPVYVSPSLLPQEDGAMPASLQPIELY